MSRRDWPQIEVTFTATGVLTDHERAALGQRIAAQVTAGDDTPEAGAGDDTA